MSFILDALKKSEAERQRQAGPTLLELRITHPRRRYPLWSLLVGALLAVNIAVLLVFLLRRPPAVAPDSAPSAAITPAPAAAGPAAPAAQFPATAATAASAAVPVRAAAGATSVPALAAQPGDSSPPAHGAGALITAPAGVGSAAPAQASPGQGSAAQASSSPADLADTAQGHNPADYEPARAAPASPGGAVDYSNLPSISQISGNVPAMQLDLLDYSELSSERYALINMQRVREGDVLADGARVLAITPNGVAMDYRGQDFLLRPGGTAQ
ncbi:MAG TPA: general secretion pathway protein GspB [Steroidobacteraceae bacterium]|jgi:general secretion pathway protein B|nr:general secretion pathway protein GspB [Steroidobacteraceae bacterium]